MLDAFIIDQMRREQERRRQERERPVVQLPVPEPPPNWRRPEEKTDTPERGVIIIGGEPDDDNGMIVIDL
jgi:hypothetical protein